MSAHGKSPAPAAPDAAEREAEATEADDAACQMDEHANAHEAVGAVSRACEESAVASMLRDYAALLRQRPAAPTLTGEDVSVDDVMAVMGWPVEPQAVARAGLIAIELNFRRAARRAQPTGRAPE